MFTAKKWWVISFALACFYSSTVFACSPEDSNYVEQGFNNGAKWTMCWEFDGDEGIYLTDITYTPPNSNTPFRVINEILLSQIFVPYDNGRDRFHDVTDYEFGGSMIKIKPQNCQNGRIVRLDTFYETALPGLCIKTGSDTTLHDLIGTPANSEYLQLFSSHQVGAYNYIPDWRFYSNGMMEFAVGATGALQTVVELNNNPAREERYRKLGWKIDHDLVGVSHIHNYFWRIDFAVGDQENDDVLKVLRYKKEGNKTVESATQITKEGRFNHKESNFKTWIVEESATSNKGYILQPGDAGHRFKGIKKEKFTRNDLHISRDIPCERYASHNKMCNGKKQLSDFIQENKTIKNRDFVVWYNLTLHHIPRGEESPEMDMHRNSFKLVPRNLY
ncbi:copper amine oxidase [Photobacterium leiognathi]|uniref:copper amine oxidase n=1 Tax=Photobacterium leiognathi TaxID=553611 RepID=UPI002982AEFC|nr:hypothetical protein [Photobacterium leiognathi]